ncbi:protein MAIN-LIKE 2-like [Lycium ferocissimum]|uniref:protein MAIN-LIKE 2-like n=1 Tax=Lycium ferocissimum TaxID=112874 RepID=UPI002815D749|nr:protein MAIN-LIKE 2-like [Lycium ferocissimum]
MDLNVPPRPDDHPGLDEHPGPDDYPGPAVHPGPADRSVLSLQGNHRSELLWAGTIGISTRLRPRRLQRAWTLLRERPPPSRLRDIASGRHLSLRDVEVLFELRVDGEPLYTRYEPPPGRTWISRQSRVQFSALCTYLEGLDPVVDGTQQDDVDRHARLYLLIIFGGILFPNLSSAFVSLRYLVFLEHLDCLGDYSWGGAVLAYLYRCLCRASIGAVRDVCGFFALLQLWAWERMLPFQPVPRHHLEIDIPYARRWTTGFDRDVDTHHSILSFRD